MEKNNTDHEGIGLFQKQQPSFPVVRRPKNFEKYEFVITKISNGPLVEIPIGIPRHRSVFEGRRWGLCSGKRNGFVRYITKPHDVSGIFFSHSLYSYSLSIFAPKRRGEM